MSEFAIRVENLSKRRIANCQFRNPKSAIRNPTSNAVPTHKGSYYYYFYSETYGNGSGRPKHRRRLFGRKRKAD